MTTTSNLPLELAPGITLDNTIGSLQLGASLGTGLFGVASIQVYYYYQHHSGDGLYVKLGVSK